MPDPTDPYFGTDEVRELQRLRDHEVARMQDTPGAVAHSRVFTADDPERLGWDQIEARLQDEGTISLRCVHPDITDQAMARLAHLSPSLHIWDVFIGDASAITAASGPIANAALPDGLRRLPLAELTPQVLRAAQEFLVASGISPFSATLLAGEIVPARMTVIVDTDNKIAATGLAVMPHNRFSRFACTGWVGLIAVAPDWRGMGLGKTVDAICGMDAIRHLGADSAMEFVAPDNAASRAVVQSCGYALQPEMHTVMISRSETRLTR